MNFKIISNFNQGSIFLDIFHAVKVKQNHSNLSISGPFPGWNGTLNGKGLPILSFREMLQVKDKNIKEQIKKKIHAVKENPYISATKTGRIKNYRTVNVKQHHSNLSIKALRGIILPETCNISLNDSIGSPFPFNIPFHPGEGPSLPLRWN